MDEFQTRKLIQLINPQNLNFGKELQRKIQEKTDFFTHSNAQLLEEISSLKQQIELRNLAISAQILIKTIIKTHQNKSVQIDTEIADGAQLVDYETSQLKYAQFDVNILEMVRYKVSSAAMQLKKVRFEIVDEKSLIGELDK